MANAYYGAMLALTDPAKFPASFSDFYPEDDTESEGNFKRVQTESEVAAAFMQFAIRQGGLKPEEVN